MILLGLGLPIALFFAYLIGQVTRWLVRRRVSVRTSTTVVLAVIGLSLGLLLSSLIFRGSDPWSLEVLLLSIACTAALLGLFALVARRFQPPRPRTSILDVARAGESQLVEFKSSARWNMHTQQRDERMELVVAKTVAGFLNADGGTLLIGVADDGTIVGLVPDFSLVKRADADRYELWLRDLLSTTLGQNAAALAVIDFAPVEVDGEATFVCRISCPNSPRPIFLEPAGNERSEFWLRSGNSTRQLTLENAIDYITVQWPLGVGRTLAAQLRSSFRGSRAG